MTSMTAKYIWSVVDRIDAVDAAIAEKYAQISDAYREARGLGYDRKAVKEVVRDIRLGQGSLDDLPKLYKAALAKTKAERAQRRSIPIENYQPPRPAGITEMRQAQRAGRPISTDNRHWSGTVYFLENPLTKRVKVGITNNLEKRWLALCQASGVELVILGTVPGGRQHEKRFHEDLKPWRVIGEWFEATPECLAKVAEMLSTHGRGRA